jgi:two-component system chemotaxis sensor kinase CheA
MAGDPYKYFRVEASDLVDQLGKGILDLERGAGAPELVARLLRLAHTLKGAARVVKELSIADRAHAIEDALASLRDSGIALTRDQIDAVLKHLDGIAARITALAPPQPAMRDLASETGQDGALREPRPQAEDIDALLDGIGEASSQLAVLRRLVGDVDRAYRLAELLSAQLGSASVSWAPVPKARSMTAELRSAVASVGRGLSVAIDQIDRELRQLRDSGERLRLLPASVLFAALERATRDAAQGATKRVAFVSGGGDFRLDAHTLGVVQGALVQAVRNAVAHGIEAEAERVAAGKNAEGIVSVEVSRHGRHVAFVCRDDGRGVDVEAVRSVAVRKGLISAASRALAVEDLLRLLLEGGISTSDAVTDIAGRGVGLDVVRDAAERLGGWVRIDTERGAGTRLEMVVPASLSSVDAVVVEVAGRSAAIPLDAVRQTLRVRMEDLAHGPDGVTTLTQDGLVPFAPLERLMGMDTAKLRAQRSWSAVVVKGPQGAIALGADRLAGIDNLVVRPLPHGTPVDPMVAGVAVDGEGNPRMVLDPDRLVEMVLTIGPMAAALSEARPPVLVIDDSLTTRMLERSILESAGYDVDLAVSGEEALEKAQRRRYALFLVDVEMPGMDGFAFIERARTDPTLRDVPAILVTSRTSTEDRQRGVSVGANAFIVKSEFQQAEFLEQIRSLVSSG